jgi:uncharacterized oligopeptide transporter (OPT) family protein
MALFQQPDAADAQLTLRAVALGSAIGFFLSITNVYLGLKIGLHIGVNLTACVVSYGLWGALRRSGLARSSLSVLESTCAVSAASSAGYATGNTLVSAFPALLLLGVNESFPDGRQLPAFVIGTWIFLIAAFGVVVAIPMKRVLLDRENLRFPSGTAAAVMLRNLHERVGEGASKARALALSAGISGLLTVVTTLPLVRGASAAAGAARPARTTLLPDESHVFDPLGTFSGRRPSDYGVTLSHGLAPLCAGVLVGLRITAWMMVGVLAGIAVTPTALGWKWQNPLGDVVSAVKGPATASSGVALWCGASMLITSSMVSLAWRWRSVAQSLRTVARWGRREEAPGAPDPEEVPTRWFVRALLLIGGALVIAAFLFFDIPPVLGILAVAMTFGLAVVACRTVGETDYAPSGPLGKVVQLTFGALRPETAATNLEAASITAGAAIASADLLNDLKTGSLLGASPRRQTVAQAIGILSGTLGSVMAYFILVPDARALRTGGFPAPAAKSWLSIALVVRHGLAGLHPMWRWGIAVGVVVGVCLTLLELLAPTKQRWVPSPFGLGLGLLQPFATVLSMLLGAILGTILQRRFTAWSERYLLVVAAGGIAGESILGVVVQTLQHLLPR